MNFLQKTKGSVSIFLVIILVPIIVVCSIFVDVSRIELAKALANSAGDLTLNTMLTQYDRELNDYYGLMASSQNIDDFLVNAENYFEACMVSQGVSTTQASRYADEITKMLGGEGEIVDFLQVNPEQSTAVIVPMSNADLTNVALMKSEMVEFMKYRSPMNNAIAFIDKMKGIEKGIAEKPMEAELTDKKNEFYEAENKLLEEALEVYKLILDYKTKGITEDYIKEVEEYLKATEASYQSLHTKLIKDWNNTEGALGQNIFYSIDQRVNKNPSSNCGYSSENTAGESVVIEATNRYNDAKKNYDNAKEAIQEAITSAPIDTAYKSADYDIQYWIQTAQALSKGNAYENFVTAANDLLQAGANLDKTYGCRITYRMKTETVTKTVTKIINGKEVEVEEEEEVTTKEDVSMADSTHSGYQSGMSSYAAVKNELSGLSVTFISQKLSEISTAAIRAKVTDSNIGNTELQARSAQLTKYDTNIKDAMDIMGKILKKLDNLNSLARVYGNTFDVWDGFVNQSDALYPENEMVNTDIGEIAKIQETLGKGENKGKSDSGEFDKVNEIIDETKVAQMKTRCNNINSLLGSFEAGIKKYQYNGTKVMEIDSYQKLKSTARLDKSRITIISAELDDYVTQTWTSPILTKPAEGDLHKVTDNNNPDIDAKSGSLKPPELYLWMRDDKFKEYTPEKHKGGLDKFENLKDQLKGLEESETDKSGDDGRNSTEEINGKAELPSNGAGTSAKVGTAGSGESGERVSAASDDMEDLTKGVPFDIAAVFETARDNLYIADYIMSMLSYDTYELEGKYKMIRENADESNVYAIAKETKISPENAKSSYEAVRTDWEKKETTVTLNKSLTNKMINKDQNVSYGNEVEYILYGGTIADNKNKANVTIFSMRYALNLAPVFGQYWNFRLVKDIAVAISAATSGVIPIPLVKMVICLGITAAETAVDMNYLKMGLPVLFLKTREDIFLLLEGIGKDDNAKITGFKKNEKMGDKSKGVYFSYSDYLYFFLFLGCIENSDSICLRTTDVVQCNMQKVTQNDRFRMKKSVVYFEMNADVKVNPLMLALPFSRAEGADVLDSSSWNNFTYHGIRGY